MQESNERQAFCLIESKAHNEPYKAGIKDFVEGTIPRVHEPKQDTSNKQGFLHTQSLLESVLED